MSKEAKTLLATLTSQGASLAAPTLFQYEVVAVLRKAVWQKRMTSEEGLAALQTAMNLSIQLYFDSALLQQAYAFAARFNRPSAYDSQYLAVAERLGCDFWTADERLFNAVRQDLSWVRWLGNLPAGIQQPSP